MRDYIILNGVNSNTITGLLISKLPPISKPKQRNTIEEIDGRDGDIVTTLGYGAYDKEIEIGLYGNFDINEVISYFNGSGTVVFSNESDKYYNYQILEQIDYEKLIRFKTATVKMHVQPFKYPLEETPVEIAYQYVNNEAEEMALDNTADAPMNIDLKGNTYQNGEPTPSTPIDIQVVSGDNEVVVCGKNLFDKDNANIIHAWFIQSSSTISSQSGNDTTIYIKCLPNTTYTVSKILEPNTTKNSLVLGTTTNLPTYETTLNVKKGYQGDTATSRTITTGANDNYLCVFCYAKANGNTYNETEMLASIQIEIGNSSSQYEPYQSQTYPIYLGVENLFDKDNANVISAYFRDSALNQLVINSTNSNKTVIFEGKPNTTYTVSKTLGDRFRIGLYNSTLSANGTYNFDTNAIRNDTAKSITITTTATNYYIYIQIFETGDLQATLDTIQIELGDKTNSYTPYGTTPIELCKIGDYQDRIYKDNGKWYLNKEIGKVVLNGNTNKVTLYGNYGDDNKPLFYMDKSDMVIPSAYTEKILMSDNYTQYIGSTPQPMANNQIRGATSTGRIYLRDDRFTTSSDFNTQLQSSNVLIKYILATPTNEEITDTTLLEQLNNLANVRSYDTSTHITQNANDKPFILNATALQKGSDTGVVNNIGNIYSKPTIDIEGTGTIGVYLEGNQMFNVDLSNSNEIIIDTTNLEAYDPTTNALMNRQVTGDYSNFKLNVGNNNVKVTGNVTKATITNYVRWL